MATERSQSARLSRLLRHAPHLVKAAATPARSSSRVRTAAADGAASAGLVGGALPLPSPLPWCCKAEGAAAATTRRDETGRDETSRRGGMASLARESQVTDCQRSWDTARTARSPSCQ